MIIYLAGGVTGNLINDWKEIMKIYLAQSSPEKNRLDDIIKIFLAGNDGYRKDRFKLHTNHLNILESYYYIRKQEWMFPLIKNFKGFLLDSGAFTFMNQNKGNVDWDLYIKEYADFINELDIKYFFELDIDSIVGIKEVEQLRSKLEKQTNKKCIPVWHVSRGHDYWLKMIKEYDYVAIGGIVTKEIRPKQYPIFNQLLREAKKENCKVHGLGFTNLKGLEKYPFYSVDSTSWLSGNRFGAVYKFNGRTMEKTSKKQGQRVKNKETALNNFIEWVKFSIYAEKYL